MKDTLNMKQTCLIGLGFFAVSVSWAVYNVYAPIILSEYLTTTFLIGLVMTIDNIFGVILQPFFGKLSDKTHSKFGKRMPYIIIGAPIAALLFSCIPFAKSLWTVMGVVILFNFVMSIWRSPVISLMPDLTPQPLQSQGNGIINLWGGIGNIFAFFFGSLLFKIGGISMPFLASGVVMVLAVAVLFLTVKENKALKTIENHQKEEQPLAPTVMDKDERKSLLLVLLAVFFWFSGFNAVETYFSLFIINTYPQLNASDAGQMLTLFSLAFLIMAVPSGYIAAKIGRKKAILIGLAIDMVLYFAMFFVHNATLLLVMLVLGGLAWAFVNINSLPMVTCMAGSGKVGAYVGYYYAFSQSASIASPILFGIIRDLTQSYSAMFLYSAVAFALAFLCILQVRHGESPTTHEKVHGMDILASMED